ncbi:MAG: CD225/dispanin family protein [Luteolibacter sp.]
MQWYYSKNGSQLGPVEQGELLAKISSGEVGQTDMCWREGMADWLPVSKVSELAMTARPSPPLTPAPPAFGGGVNSPYTPPTVAAQNPATYAGQNIPNYLWQSIVVTLFCCLPFGIPAIVYAAKVDSLKAVGDIPGARAASSTAKMWCLVSGGIGLVLGLGWLVLAFASAISAAAHH